MTILEQISHETMVFMRGRVLALSHNFHSPG